MSDIDMIKHYRLGLFFGIPVYQCLEDGCWIGKTDKAEPSSMAEKNDICIGGGSGEHPAIVIKKIDSCVARYLKYTGRSDDDIIKSANIRLNSFIIYCNWKKENHGEFYERCCYSYKFFRKNMSFEGWIAANIGEFIFHLIPSYTPLIKKWHDKECNDHDIIFGNILFPYGKYSGNGLDRFRIVDIDLKKAESKAENDDEWTELLKNINIKP